MFKWPFPTELVRAMITKYHKLGGLHEGNLSQFWKLEVLDQGVIGVGFFWSLCPCFTCKWPPSPSGSGLSFYVGLCPNYKEKPYKDNSHIGLRHPDDLILTWLPF